MGLECSSLVVWFGWVVSLLFLLLYYRGLGEGRFTPYILVVVVFFVVIPIA